VADVFFSYASEDRERIRPIVAALEDRGVSVWWDRDIQAGTAYDREIEAAIDQASCMVVAWSQHSVDSEYVRSEVEEGARRDILIPVQLDTTLPPLAHRRRQAVDLSDWTGANDPRFESLIAGIEAVTKGDAGIARGHTHVSHTPAPSTNRRSHVVLVGVALILLIGMAWVLLTQVFDDAVPVYTGNGRDHSS